MTETKTRQFKPRQTDKTRLSKTERSRVDVTKLADYSPEQLWAEMRNLQRDGVNAFFSECVLLKYLKGHYQRKGIQGFAKIVEKEVGYSQVHLSRMIAAADRFEYVESTVIARIDRSALTEMARPKYVNSPEAKKCIVSILQDAAKGNYQTYGNVRWKLFKALGKQLKAATRSYEYYVEKDGFRLCLFSKKRLNKDGAIKAAMDILGDIQPKTKKPASSK